MNDFSVTRLARLIEFLNPLALLELGLAVQQEVNHPAFPTAPGAESPWKIAWLLLWRVVEAGLRNPHTEEYYDAETGEIIDFSPIPEALERKLLWIGRRSKRRQKELLKARIAARGSATQSPDSAEDAAALTP